MNSSANKVLFVVATTALAVFSVVRYYLVYPREDEIYTATPYSTDEYGQDSDDYEESAVEESENEYDEEDEEGHHDYGPGKVALSDLTPYKEDNYDCFYYSDSLVDNVGNEHSDAIYILAGTCFTNCVAKSYYYLDGAYTKMQGSVFLTEYGKNNEYVGRIEFFGDGRSLFSIEDITTGFLPRDFEIDLTGVKELAICIEDPGWDGAGGDRCLGETVLFEADT